MLRAFRWSLTGGFPYILKIPNLQQLVTIVSSPRQPTPFPLENLARKVFTLDKTPMCTYALFVCAILCHSLRKTTVSRLCLFLPLYQMTHNNQECENSLRESIFRAVSPSIFKVAFKYSLNRSSKSHTTILDTKGKFPDSIGYRPIYRLWHVAPTHVKDSFCSGKHFRSLKFKNEKSTLHEALLSRSLPVLENWSVRDAMW